MGQGLKGVCKLHIETAFIKAVSRKDMSVVMGKRKSDSSDLQRGKAGDLKGDGRMSLWERTRDSVFRSFK